MRNCPEVRIIMLNYNGRKDLGPIFDKCIQSVLNTDYPDFGLLFVDNNSVDDSVDHVRKRYGNDPRLVILQLDKNYGYAKANNIAAKRYPESEYLAFINNDILVPRNWLSKIIEILEPEISRQMATLSPVIYDKSVEKFIGGTYIEYPSGRYYVPLFDDVKRLPGRIFEVDFPPGECFIICRDAFSKIGGFDDQYFLYHDDGDLGWRLRLEGYKVAMTTEVSVIHFRSSTVKKEFELAKQKRFFESNRLKSCLKNLEFRSLIALPIVEISTFAAISILAFFKRKYRPWPRGYMLAIWDVLHKLTFEKRREVQDRRLLSDKELFKGYFSRVKLAGSKWFLYALYRLIA
ncbi:MAG: glycosyltransferase family 2 protein [Promethearchaeota archaeon]